MRSHGAWSTPNQRRLRESLPTTFSRSGFPSVASDDGRARVSIQYYCQPVQRYSNYEILILARLYRT